MNGQLLSGGAVKADQPRVVIFTHDGRGLGHLRRLSLIAKSLQRECAVLIVTGHRSGSWMIPEECEFVHLPSLDSLDFRRSRHWGRQPFWADGELKGRSLRKALLEAVFDVFQPHAMILDYLPMGQEGEMFEFILQKRAEHCYFILRGVLGDGRALNEQILNAKGRRLLSEFYKRIFVAADARIIDVVEEYALPREIAEKVVYAGYVVDCGLPELRHAMRKERGIPSTAQWVVCSAGGGKYGEDLIENCYDLIDLFPETYFDVVLGPRSRLALAGTKWIDFPRVRILKEDSALATIHAACDVLISRGGYNSMLEGLVGGTSVIAVPIPGDSEQYPHAMRLSKYCAVEVVTDLFQLPVQLEKALEAGRSNGTPSCLKDLLNINGASVIKEHIMRDLTPASQMPQTLQRSR